MHPCTHVPMHRYDNGEPGSGTETTMAMCSVPNLIVNVSIITFFSSSLFIYLFIYFIPTRQARHRVTLTHTDARIITHTHAHMHTCTHTCTHPSTCTHTDAPTSLGVCVRSVCSVFVCVGTVCCLWRLTSSILIPWNPQAGSRLIHA